MSNINIDVLIRAKDEATKVLEKFGAVATQTGKNGATLATNFKALAAGMAVVGTAFTGVGTAMVGQAAKFEQYRIALNTIIGDTERAGLLFEQIKETAKKTPFQFEEVLVGTKQLVAYGFATDDVIKEMTMLGDVAAGLSIPLGDMTYLYGTLRTQQVAYTRDLQQFAMRGIPIWEEVAKVMKISVSEVKGAVEDGQVSFEIIQQAFQNMTGEGGKFHNLMQEQAKTTAGQFSNLKDSVQLLAVTLGAALLPSANAIMQSITPMIEKFGEWAAKNQELVSTGMIVAAIIGVIGAAALILGPVITGLTAVFGALSGAINIVITIVGGMVTVLGGPLTIAIFAIMAVVALLALAWKNNWLGIRDKVQAFIDWFKGTALPAIEGVFNWIKDTVGKVANFWIERFNAIRNAINTVVDGIRNIISAAENMANKVRGGLKIPGFATGGIVGGPIGQPTMALVHGGEEITPYNKRESGTGGSGVTFEVNIGMYAGSEVEKRNIASDLYASLVRVAQSQNVTVAELLGA